MEKKKKKTPIFKRLMPYAGRKGGMIYIAMVLSGVSGIMLLIPMVYIHKIISHIILDGQLAAGNVKEYAIKASIFAGIGLLLYTIGLLVSHIFAFEVEDNIIKVNVKKLMGKPLGYFANKESGKIRNVIVEGAAQTHAFLAHQLPDMAMTGITPVILLVFFFLFDWRLGLASMIPIILGLALMSTMMGKKIQKMQDRYYGDLANLSSETVEYVRGIPVVKTFAQSVESFDKLYSLINSLKDCVMKLTMSYREKMSLYEAVGSSTSFFLVPVAILLITNGGNIKEVVAHSIIYFLIGPAFGIYLMRSAIISKYIYFAELSLDKIDDILDYEDISYGNEKSFNEGIEFRDVSFSYKDKRVLNSVSFSVRKGETVALVGSSGGGKTTIAKLAARFYDTDSGDVLIGGKNIKGYNKIALMKNISFVFQNSRLFKMSLRENLLIGKENATDDEIYEALRRAGAIEIVDRLENGLDTVYGSKGTYFSGGEAQRLAIARAFLKNAEYIILDEATAFTDPENEHIIQASFKELSKDKTTLMIAHRLSNVVNVDRILVVDNGKIVEEGTHEELISKAGLYNKLWKEYKRAVDWKIGGVK